MRPALFLSSLSGFAEPTFAGHLPNSTTGRYGELEGSISQILRTEDRSEHELQRIWEPRRRRGFLCIVMDHAHFLGFPLAFEVGKEASTLHKSLDEIADLHTEQGRPASVLSRCSAPHGLRFRASKTTLFFGKWLIGQKIA